MTTITRISPAELSSQLATADKPYLLDVRTPVEHQEINLPMARLAPLDALDCQQIITETGADRECVVICRSGARATKAAEKLAAAGMKNVRVLEGGMLAWDAAGQPVTRGQKAMSLERQVRIAAGALVFTGVLLAHFVNLAFIWLPGFVGAGLMFAGITDTCAMGMLIAKAPWNKISHCKCTH